MLARLEPTAGIASSFLRGSAGFWCRILADRYATATPALDALVHLGFRTAPLGP